MDQFFYKLSNEVLNKMRYFEDKIKNKIKNENENAKGALESFKILFKYNQCISDNIPDSMRIYDAVYDTLNEFFIKSTKKISKLADIGTDGQVKFAEKACENILIFYSFQYTFEGKEQKLLSENALEKGSKAFEKIRKFFQENVDSFSSAIDELKLMELAQTLKNSKKWDNLLQEIKKVCSSLDSSFLHNFESIKSFENIYKEFETKVVDLSNTIKSQKLITRNTKKFEKDREDLYKNLMSAINKLKEINKQFKDLLGSNIDFDKLEKETISELNKKIEKIKNNINEETSKETLTQADCDKFRVYYQHLEMFSKCVSFSVIDVKETLKIAESKIFEKIDKINKEILLNFKNIRPFAEKIVEIAFFGENIYIFQKKINVLIDTILDKFRQENGQKGIAELSMQLENLPNGSRIISEHSALAGED